ncbi:hypothetical protein Aph01nite_43780 [Acrocarpospora phusangensis]|uniref:Head-tail adaptor protein n=1 Tax=Acrocarpospora phusangensis TaxID=1070424 RepID=A0A919QEL3_9ACTN|nr:hypothetical protein [Acrocarpospora phusangensis]GIH26068.1 hypothetical protein Aph01nite_43780 [Acrocarpospora phusangensis]
MSGFLPTTTVAVLRGETTDEYGDVVDSDAPVKGHVPISLSERDKRVWVPAENRTTVVRQITGRARPNADIREGDRLRDEGDQSIYLVEGVSRPQSPIGAADVRLTLRRVDDQPR